MAQQFVGSSRYAQRAAGAQINANFSELYARHVRKNFTATANTTFTVPAGYMIEHVAFQNTTANAVTGGVKLGTTSGGTEVVSVQGIAANEIAVIAGANMTKRIFSTSAETTIYLQTNTNWNSASVNFSIILRRMY